MAIIKEIGTIAHMSEVQSGTSQTGNPWYRQTIVVDVAGYNGSYRKVALQASGNMVGDLEGAAVGDKVEISYQVTAREWNGKWYNNVDLYKVQFLEPAMPQMQQPVAPAYPQYPQQQMPQVNPQMPNKYEVCDRFCRQPNCDYQFGAHGEPCKAAMAAAITATQKPAAPAPRGRRVASTPQIPANTPMDLQEDDLPPSFYPQQ